MAADLIELTASIVISHVSMTEMSSEELLTEIKAVHAILKGLTAGEMEAPDQEPRRRGRPPKTAEAVPEERPAPPEAPAMGLEEAFKPDQVGCMVCGKRGMKTLKRHLASAHGLKPGQYRRRFNIPKDQPLAAPDYVAKRRQNALERGLGEKLAAARAARKGKRRGE